MAAQSSPPLPSPWRQRLGEVRHDLRSPLGETIGFVDMILEESREAGLAVIEEPLKALRQHANVILAEVNHVLNPETLRHSLATLDPLQQKIHNLSGKIATEAAALSATCTDLGEKTFADDLRRVAESALRLQQMTPEAIEEVIQASADTTATAAPFAFASAEETSKPGAPTDSGAILVVDDLEANRSLLDRRLTKQGYTVTLAAHGREALSLLRAQRFDLILLDIRMPELDGLEVLSRVKADPALAHLPVIMLSALDELDSVVRCINLGADDYLPKPFPPAILNARVRACLDAKRMSDRLRKYAGWLFGRSLFSNALAEPAALVLSRQERTVLFADIRGFTQWSERHTPEEAVAMLNAYFETAEGLWAESSIIKTEYTGDEIMGVFPTAEDAVRVAEAMRRHLSQRLVPFGLGIGIGVHTGLVIEGLMGGADVKAYRFVGDTVNTAKRICSEAKSGQVLLSRSAHDKAGPLARFDAPTDVAMKGKADLFTVYALLES